MDGSGGIKESGRERKEAFYTMGFGPCNLSQPFIIYIPLTSQPMSSEGFLRGNHTNQDCSTLDSSFKLLVGLSRPTANSNILQFCGD